MTAAVTDAPVSQTLSEQTFAGLRDFIRPTPDEMRWQADVPWRTSFWSAVVEAQARDLPLLAWAMNGHPLART